MSDPLWITGRPFPITIAGQRWEASPLTFAGRDAINAALREAYPHPFSEAKALVRDLDPVKEKDLRDFILETYRDRLNQTGWPITLDSLDGRALMMAHDRPRAELTLAALKPNHPDLDLDRAHELLSRASWSEFAALVEVALELRPSDPGERSEGPADPKGSGALTDAPSQTPG